MKLSKKFKVGDLIRPKNKLDTRIFKLLGYTDQKSPGAYITAIEIITAEPHFFSIEHLDTECKRVLTLRELLEKL